MAVSIRLAIEKDAKQIAYVHIASWQAIYRGYISDNFLDNLSLQKREYDWQARLKDGVIVWVIELNTKIIGFASLSFSSALNDASVKIPEISAIYLLPEYWHKGFGTELYEVVSNYVLNSGFNEIIIWVLQENRLARNFYERVGFDNTREIKIANIGGDDFKLLRYRKILN